MAGLAVTARIAADTPGTGGEDIAFYGGKLRACRFFFECELPKADQWLSFAASLSDVAAEVPADYF